MTAATIATVGAIALTVATGGIAAPVIAAGAAHGLAIGSAGAALGTATGVAATTAAATAAGAVAGATTVAAGTAGVAAGSVLTGAATGAVIAGSTAASVSSVSVGAAGLATTGIAAGPLGWILLGADDYNLHNGKGPATSNFTFDCWKPILHSYSLEPSDGKLLREIIMDPCIKQVIITPSKRADSFPHLEIINRWEERFHVEYVTLPNKQIAAHAVLI
uniref:Uncharacterized protein n=1 Tax=Biomphalaria glabrata TaxID=6526 RepID=A0A2C9JVE0_BIOGL